MKITKLCAIDGCLTPIAKMHPIDEDAGLCPGHYYALKTIERRPCMLPIPNGEKRETFLGIVRLVAQFDREKLIKWRKANPSTVN